MINKAKSQNKRNKQSNKELNRSGCAPQAVVALLIIVGIALAAVIGVRAWANRTATAMKKAMETSEAYKAVESLFEGNYSVPVQYAESSFLFYSLNSKHEQHAESQDIVNGSDNTFAKVYTSDNNVVYLMNDGGITWGPEYSPIDFIQATVLYSAIHPDDVKQVAQNAREYLLSQETLMGGLSEFEVSSLFSDGSTANIYTFEIKDISTYEKIYAQLNKDMAKGVGDAMREIESTGAGEITKLVLTVSPGEGTAGNGDMMQFEAYFNYLLGDEPYLGWYIGGCAPINYWELPSEWYEDYDSKEPAEIFDMYNRLVDTLNEAWGMESEFSEGVGITVDAWRAEAEDAQKEWLKRAEGYMETMGYEYSDGADLDTWYDTIIETIVDLEPDSENDAMAVMCSVGLGEGVWRTKSTVGE